MLQCRGCLKKGTMIPFDENTITSFNLLTNLNVQSFDSMPQQLCKLCHEMVKRFKDFREKCISSNSILFNNFSDKIIIKDEDAAYCEIKIEKKEIELIDDEISFEDNIEMDDDNLIYELIKTEDSKQKKTRSKRLSAVDHSKRESKRIKCKKTPSNLSGETNKRKCDPQKFKKPEDKKEFSTTTACGLCTATVDKTKLTEHLESHKTCLLCRICLFRFSEWSQLLSHRLKHLNEEEKRCHICSKRYLAPPSLEYHYRKIHCNEKNPILKCPQCIKCYKIPRLLYKHMKYSHSEKALICDYCSKVFKTKDHIRTHVIAYMDHKPYKCDQCDFSCKIPGILKIHKLRKHTAVQIKCKKCCAVFVNEKSRDTHDCKLRTQVCPTCGKSIRTNRLKGHMRSHAAAGQYACERCDAVYRSRGGLRTHRLMHDGVRTHSCDLCPAAFYYSSVLIKHRRTHTGIKPYVCKVCDKAFTGNHNLKVHMRVHGEYLITKKNAAEEIIPE